MWTWFMRVYKLQDQTIFNEAQRLSELIEREREGEKIYWFIYRFFSEKLFCPSTIFVILQYPVYFLFLILRPSFLVYYSKISWSISGNTDIRMIAQRVDLWLTVRNYRFCLHPLYRTNITIVYRHIAMTRVLPLYLIYLINFVGAFISYHYP